MTAQITTHEYECHTYTPATFSVTESSKVTVVPKESVSDPYTIVKKINSTIDWEEYDSGINSRYVEEDNGVIFEFAKKSGKYVGYAIVRGDRHDCDAVVLAFIAVEKGYQGQKVGSQLLDSTIKKMHIHSFKKINLDCNTNNLKFYESYALKNHLSFSYDQVGPNRYDFTYILAK